MRTAVGLTLLCFMSFPCFGDDMSVSDFKLKRGAPATREYVAGIGEGMDFLNYQFAKAGRDPLFCVPSGLKLNADNYLNVLDQELARDPKKNSGLRPLVASMVDGLRVTFPCKH